MELSPRLLMTSITAYLTALAHSSSEQRVLKANIQTSTGDTDVCRKKCSVSVFNRQRSERCEHSPNFTLQWNYLNSCDAGVDLMSFAGLERTHKGASKAGKIMEISFLHLYSFIALLTQTHTLLLLCLSTSRASVRRLGVRPLGAHPPTPRGATTSWSTHRTHHLPSMLRHFCLTSWTSRSENTTNDTSDQKCRLKFVPLQPPISVQLFLCIYPKIKRKKIFITRNNHPSV